MRLFRERALVTGGLAFVVSVGMAGPRSSVAAIEGFRATQTSYSLEDPRNAVVLDWTELGTPPASIEILLDGLVAKTVAGKSGANDVLIDDIAAGAHLFEARVGSTIVAQKTQTVVEFQPMGDPQNVACATSGEDCEITITFTNPGPPAGAFEVEVDGVLATAVDGSPGNGKVATGIVTTSGEHCVTLVGVIESPEGRYLSDPVSICCDVECASAGNRFVRGACNGAAQMDLSSAVFGLSFLFSGGTEPPCRVACDSNGDGAFDISDMVYVLAYLFLGGPAPQGWKDSSGDGKPDPTCQTAPASECTASSASCPP